VLRIWDFEVERDASSCVEMIRLALGGERAGEGSS